MAKATDSSTETTTVEPTQPANQNQPAPSAPRAPVVTSGQPVEVSFQTGHIVDRTAPTAGQTVEPEPQKSAEKTLTQSEVNALIGNLRRELEKKFEDQLAAKEAEKTKEAENAKLTEAQRQAKERQEMEAKLKETESRWQIERRKNAIIAAAVNAKVDPEAAVRLVDTAALQFDDNGNATNAADLVKVIADKWPGLVQKPVIPQTQSVNPARDSQPAGKTDAERRQEYFGGNSGVIWKGGGVTMPTWDGN